MSFVRFSTFPRTIPPQPFAATVAQVFRDHEAQIGTNARQKGLTSDEVLAEIGSSLLGIGFQIEVSKKAGDKIMRPVYYGENGRRLSNIRSTPIIRSGGVGLRSRLGGLGWGTLFIAT